VALARNPEIEAAGHQIDKARAGVSAARAEYIPQVGAFVQYIHENGAPFVSPNTGVVGLNLKWTVFEFGKRRGQVSERRAEVAQAEENLSQVRRHIQVDVEKAVRKLNRAETALDSARRLLASATEARRVTSDRVEAGTANQSVLLDAEAAISGAQADLLRAEYQRSVAAADLARLAGTELTDEIACTR
jgi:outer membrane protein